MRQQELTLNARTLEEHPRARQQELTLKLGRKGAKINKGINILHLLNPNSGAVSADSEVSLIFLIEFLIAPFLISFLIAPILSLCPIVGSIADLIGPINSLVTH